MRSNRMDRRHVRAQAATAAVMTAIRTYLDRNYESDVARKVMDLFMQDGIEILSDYTRQQIGLPPRGPDGWTAEEIHIYERRLLELMASPPPPIFIAKEPANAK